MPETSKKPEPAPSEPPSDETNKRVVRNAGIVGILTILSRILGLYRFRLMAQLFGATGVADAFNFAFVFPNLTRRLFGEGLLTSAFVPVFSGMLARGEKDAANKTASVLLTKLLYWLSAGCVAVIALTEVARWVWPSFGTLTEDDLLLIRLFQAMLPYLILINAAAVMMGVLNSLGHFLVPAFAPALLNVAMIAACLFVVPHLNDIPQKTIWAVAIAVLIGGVLQLLVQFPPAFARGFKFKPSTDVSDPGYSEVMANFKPVLLMVAVFQLNVMMDNIIAQTLIPGDGPVTYLNMGTSVYQLPWAIIALALGTVALPLLSQYWAQKKEEPFTMTLSFAMRVCIFLAIPFTVGTMLLSEEIVRLLYGTGKFLENDAEPVRRTAGVVMFSSLGLVFYSVNAILARALYAMKDMRTPATTSAKSVGLNFALNLFFVLVLPLLAGPLESTRGTISADRKSMLSFIDLLFYFTNLRESGIALASTISTAWQTWMLARAVKERLTTTAPLLPSGSNLVLTFGGYVLISLGVSLIAYRQLVGKPDMEGFIAFFAAAFGAIFPFWLLSHQYFVNKLKDKPHEADVGSCCYGVKDEHWSESLRFEYTIYSTLMASAIMGFVVWAVRDSVPPEGSGLLVFQRAVVPVILGIVAYYMAAGSMMSSEFEQLRRALERRTGHSEPAKT
ncbi:MAG TPA: murein biosynthesis integral membrane protein MurJ [Planctomycetota bacterium]|nr:murein biosynthesis integral membrane protein MurJ [Planctomycetota bacterium]